MQKILIVDDTKNIRLLLQTCLEAAGYQVQTAENGELALRLLQTATFALIFLDIKLPELSGTEVLRRMRGQGVKTPVIIMTAFATVKNAVECTKLGAVTYLQKPFTADKVRRIVAEVLASPVKPDVHACAALQTQPDLPLFSSIRTMIAQAEFAQADVMLKTALVENPLSDQVYYLFGQLSAAQGNSATAAKYYAIAEQLQKFVN
jgi:two-component system OmpR family response regulator